MSILSETRVAGEMVVNWLVHPRDHRSLDTIVVIGASLAGFNVARALRAEGYRGALHLVGEEPHLPYDRPSLSKDYLTGNADESSIWLAGLDEFDTLDLVLTLGRSAVQLDVDRGIVVLDDGEELGYDALVIATGARPRLVAGLTERSRPPSVHTLRSIDDARALSARLVSPRAGSTPRVVVVGSGFIGCEVASTARILGAAVTIVESGEAPMGSALGVEIGQILATRQQRQGISVLCGATAREIMATGNTVADLVTEVRLADGRTLNADIVVVGVGVEPATEWLVGSGLLLDDGLVCDESLRTCPDVWAVGDVARWGAADRPTRRLEHWTNAIAQAEHVAHAIVTGRAEPFNPVPYYWSDQLGQRIEVIGVPPLDATVQFIHGNSESDSLVAVYRRDTMIHAVVGIDAGPQMLRFRRSLRIEPPWEETLFRADS